ncbi:alpha/beta hydrolase [bacterium]|nr:MAG: alpha/beta hydrolase [bacterium]
MKTKLLEILTGKNQNLRGIISMPDDQIQKGLICLHGFERNSSTEKKFKALSDSLVEKMIAVLKLDFSGCGLSDGDFRFTTIEKQADDFVIALRNLQMEIGQKRINVVAHSLGACVLATKIDEVKDEIGKIILIAPALNQKDLMRYWFITSTMKKSNPEIEITWQNYKQYLDENAFHKDCERTDKMTKSNYIEPKYFLETKDFDFSNEFDSLKDKVLHIHGSKDIAVPMESLNITFDNQIIITDGDHDLERPNQLEQWRNKAVNFLLK